MPSNKIEKFKLPKIFEKVQDNENRLENIEIINVRNQDVAYNKKLNKIIILKDQPITGSSVFSTFVVTFDFLNLPEYAIDFMKVHSVFHTTDAFELNEHFAPFFTVNHQWKQVGSTVILRYYVRAAFSVPNPGGGFSRPPLLLDLEINVLNNFVWHQIQQPKE